MATKTIEQLIQDSNDFDEIQKKRQRLVEKWDKTGLLKGLKNGTRNQYAKNGMAQLLENESKMLLKEASTDSGVGGFMNVAFPLVRRVFGPLFAQELVSVQPMSLPSGLLFYLDFTYNDTIGPFTANGSVFGNPTGNLIATSGTLGTGGPYLMRDSYAQRVINSTTVSGSSGNRIDGTSGSLTGSATWADVYYDPALSSSTVTYILIPTGSLTSSSGSLDLEQVSQISVTTGSATHLRQHNTIIYPTADPYKPSYVKCFFTSLSTYDAVGTGFTASWVCKPTATESSGITLTPLWESDFATTPSPVIREVNLKINSTTVTANDRKIRAKWSPEMAQDLNAYHNLDAEVEITQILSEQITLDIDLEILDMLTKAAIGPAGGATYYWSRRVGKYVDQTTGGSALSGTAWYGTRREWYETLVETINGVANEIYRKTLRGRANFLVISPKVQTILQSTALWRASVSADPKEMAFTVGMEKVGSLDNRFNVYVSPYFYDNLILVGYKGNSWLEVGAAYCPYVPLIMTPTIFAPEDFTPRKGLMTRYGKKVVNSAFYGSVIIQDFNG